MKQSAGILLYRKHDDQLQVLLVHPAGPFFKNKDAGAWTIPKGEFLDDEDALAAAKREFFEETGHPIDGSFIKLKPVKQKSGKIVHAWAVEGDIDADNIVSNTFPLEWPPKSGKFVETPEIDKADWFTVAGAEQKINTAQFALIEELAGLISL